jgi:hypothetical protein
MVEAEDTEPELGVLESTVSGVAGVSGCSSSNGLEPALIRFVS